MLRFVLLMLSLFNVAFCFAYFIIVSCCALFCWIFSSFNVTLCSIELNSGYSFVLLLDFGKVKVKCCKCALWELGDNQEVVGLFSKFLWKLRLFRAVSGDGP
jgi:hypothetical protein